MNLFRFLAPKIRLSSSGLLQGMTEIHTHLPSGSDEEVDNKEEIGKTLVALKELGIKQAFLTPLITEEMKEGCKENYRQMFQKMLMKAPEGIELKLAGKYLLDTHFPEHLKQGLLTYPGKQVLVRMPYEGVPPELMELLYESTLEGYTPVLAHPERYNHLSGKEYARLKRRGCLFQLNLLSVTGYHGSQAAQRATYLLKKGYYDFAGLGLHKASALGKGIGSALFSRQEVREIEKLLENNRKLW